MKLLIIVFTLFCCILNVNALELIAHLSQNGLHGQITFIQHTKKQTEIKSLLNTTLQYPDQIWSWGIYQFPTDYSDIDPKRRCSSKLLGNQLVSFDDSLGYLTLPGNESSVWYFDQVLTGENGFWGKSLLLSNPHNGFKICATITTKDSSSDYIAEAKFLSPIAGSIYFRWLTAKNTEHLDTLVYTNLYEVGAHLPSQSAPNIEHSWKIYVTDIFEKNTERPENNCNVLQLVFNPNNSPEGESMGDIDNRLGKIKVSTNRQAFEVRNLYHDSELVLFPKDLTTSPQRQLYVVIFDSLHKDNFLACAKIRHIKEKIVIANFNEDHIKGHIKLQQRNRFEPVWLDFSVSSANDNLRSKIKYAHSVTGFKITNLPPNPMLAHEADHCMSTASTYNPTNINHQTQPPDGYGTQDQYPVGDLLGKLKNRNEKYYHNAIIPGLTSELSGIYWDVFLTLEGRYSVVHRGMIIEKSNDSQLSNIESSIHACGTLLPYDKRPSYQTPMRTLQVLFSYPIVGRILFKQPRDEPWLDTTIIIEYLIHSDGSTLQTTNSHRWAIQAEVPGLDFYNWTGRCLSTKEIFDPYEVIFNADKPEQTCKPENSLACRMGDLSNRHGGLIIAGGKQERSRSRMLFTDDNLPLSGYNKIAGKSVVIYDDFGPVARGSRLACSRIQGYNWRKSVARDWYGNGEPLTLKGRLEIFQQSEYHLTNVEVHFKGLMDNSGYHVHVAPVVGDLEFPCEGTSLYGHWNPRKVDPKTLPMPASDSSDQYEMGDLSGKFGTLEGLIEYSKYYNDTNLPLFGYETVLGRSIVIHKRLKMLRWACSSLERGYSPSEAREIRAIASFHNPAGYAYGYIRLTQLVYNDGSQSDTIIEVNLRHPGENDRNITYNHNWSIFVNPVGVDATVKDQVTRCVAAGFIWNPYYTQLADPLNVGLYLKECGADNPLRCYVGDVSRRVGPIDLGGKRTVYSDTNFPLEGNERAVGRSIVIFGPNYSSERFACANIEPDHDIIKYINLQKPPKFVVAQFLEDVRNVLGVPEWMLSIDSRKTKTLHNEACIQMIIHFKGAQAHKMELDFSQLISSGKLGEPTISCPGYVTKNRKTRLSYRKCGVRDPNGNRKSRKKQVNSAHQLSGSLPTILFCYLFFRIYA